MRMPATIHGSFQGTAAGLSGLARQPSRCSSWPRCWPSTSCSGFSTRATSTPSPSSRPCPRPASARLLALLLFHMELNVIALIGIILLIGIVKKNAIMMIDFALEAERQGRTAPEAIYEAALLRFRPIMMTTAAALFGALPTGPRPRHRLGIAPAAGHQHRRRPYRQPDADPVHHACRLHLSRPVPGLAAESPSVAQEKSCQGRDTGFRGLINYPLATRVFIG